MHTNVHPIVHAFLEGIAMRHAVTAAGSAACSCAAQPDTNQGTASQQAPQATAAVAIIDSKVRWQLLLSNSVLSQI
jgi:hypothetical protein